MIETMTVRELVTDLRARGVKTSETMERANIVHGIYPFAHGIDTGKSTSCRIYAKMYRDWLRERGLEMKWVKEKMEEKMVTTFKAGAEDVKLSPAIVKDYLVSGDRENVTSQEIVMFINLCKFQHLNPFLHEAYLIKYGSEPATLVVGKSALEKRAVRSEKYKGFKAGVVVVDGSGALTEREGTLVLENETLVGGWAEIYVEGLL